MDVRDVPYICVWCKSFWDSWWRGNSNPRISFATYHESSSSAYVDPKTIEASDPKICASCDVKFMNVKDTSFCIECAMVYIYKIG